MSTATRQSGSAEKTKTQAKPRYSPTTSARLSTKCFRMLTSPMRVHPNFIIIGAMRCGTTSLFEYLVQHPQIMTPLYKEVRYFTDRYWLGPLFYRACFPTWRQMQRQTSLGPPATFDATPAYMFNPAAVKRIKQKLPDVRLVAILRDPIDRAISHYRFARNNGWETLDFDAAIAAEPERMRRLPGESDAKYYDRPSIRRLSYMMRGQYAPQLQRVVETFGHDHLHVMCFETLISNPQPTFERMLEFLGLEPYDGIEFKQHHGAKAAPPEIAPETMQRLRESFTPHYEPLRREFGDIFPWAREEA